MQIGLTLKQIEERRSYIGGSDASIIAGKNRYQDDFKLWEFKTGRFTPNEEDMSNKFTNAGHVFEPLILELFKARLKDDFDTDITYDMEMRENKHPKYSFIVSHPDAVLSTNEILDCKTANQKAFLKNWGTEKGNPMIPVEYQYQGIWNSGVYYRETGIIPKKFYIPVMKMTNKDYDIADMLASQGQLASLDNLATYYLSEAELKAIKQQAMNKYNKELQKGNDLDIPELIESYEQRKLYLKLRKKLEIRIFDFDLRTFEALEKNAIAWWEKHIINDEKPKITAKSASYLKEKYKYSTEGKDIEVGGELDKLVSRFKAGQHRLFSLKHAFENTEEHREWEKQIKVNNFNEMMILEKIKDAESATGDLIEVTAWNATRHSLNYEALKRNEPEIYNKLVESKVLKISTSDRMLSYTNKIK